jgi:hypothetical protein
MRRREFVTLLGRAGMRVGTPTQMTAAWIGPEAAVDVLKDALSY